MAKRRANGEGNVQHRKDGRWSVTLVVGYKPDGKPERKTVYGKTQKEALEAASVLRDQLERGVKIDKRLSFCDWADKWYEDYKGSVRESTYENYEYTLRLCKRLFERRKLNSIKAMDIEAALKQLIDEDYSRSQISKVKAMLNQIFRKAEANGLIERNPVQLTEKTRIPKKPTAKDSFTIDEIAILFRELPDNATGHAIRLCLTCGMRPQELLGLEKEHIEPDGSVIHIRQAVQNVGGKTVVGDTKSVSGIRDIPVPTYGRASAVFLREQAEGFVLPSTVGGPMNSSTWRKHYKAVLEKIEGVRFLPPHCCRHTYITMLHASGVDFNTIQTLAGQTDDDATRGYMHIKNEVTARAVGLLEQTLSAGLDENNSNE